MSTERLHIIDGSGYIFRAYYAIRALRTSGGEPTNATYGFTTMIEKALREEAPRHIAITFDTAAPTFRREIYSDYKATRSPPPDDLPRQIPRIHQITDAFRLRKLLVQGFEADDVIATLTRMALEKGFGVEIITGDKDLMQLVSDRVRIYEPMRGLRIGPKEVEEKFGVPPEKLTDLLALSGDSSDNVPGVRGIGEKKAALLIRDFGDLEGVLEGAAAGKIKGKMGEALVESVEIARLSRRLIQLRFDVPLDVSIEDLRYRGPDRARLRALFSELEFRRLVAELDTLRAGDSSSDGGGDGDGERDGGRRGEGAPADPSGAAEGSGGPRSSGSISVGRYRTILEAEDLKAVLRRIGPGGRIGLALETASARIVDADPVGLALAFAPGEVVYVPVGHRYLGCPSQLPLSDVLGMLRPVLEDPAIGKVSSETKTIAAFFERYGIVVKNLAFDSTIGSYLLEPDDVAHGAASVARRYLGHEPLERAEVLVQEKARLSIEAAPIELAAKLAGERAEIAWRATDAMREALDAAGVHTVLKDVELPLVPVLARMELQGVKIDVDRLLGMSSRFADELVRLERACYEAAGKEFNIGSPKQLQKILFEELGLKIVKRTKTGPSTDASVLEALADAHPLPQTILDYRQVQKLKSTYVDALPKMVSPKTGRVHTSFSQSVAATGRLSSTDPNLQNIPIRSDLGRELRKVFIADPGNVLISVDYSQVELRVLAHFSEDPILMDAFTRGVDVHTRTAAALFEIDPEDVTREQRTQAKAVNFGVLYGMGAVRLARDLKIPRRTASKFVDDYFERQKGVRRYIDDTLEFARQHGFVRTLIGRRRMLPDITSQNRGARAQAERIAINTPIQGSAADLIKLAMIRLDGRLVEERAPAKILLQVHDELLVEAKREAADVVAALVRREMEHVYPLKVPLIAEARWGETWDAAH